MPQRKESVQCKFVFSTCENWGEIDVESLYMDGTYFGHPLNKQDMNDIYRYLTFVFKKDDIDKKKLLQSFKSSIKQLENFVVGELGLMDKTVTIYGVIRRNKCIFDPKHFEYDKYVRTRYIGSINRTNDKFDFIHDNFYVGQVRLNGKIYFFNDFRLDDKSDKEFHRGLIDGHHEEVFNVFLIKDQTNPNKLGGTLCLVDQSYNLCDLHWREIHDFVEPGANYVGISDRQSKDYIWDLIDNNSNDEVSFDSEHGCVIAKIYEHSSKPCETWLNPYVAYEKDQNGHNHIVGVAIDSLARPSGQYDILTKYINSIKENN